jgi:hypothetical protein
MKQEKRTEIYIKGAYTEPKDGDMWEFSDGVFYYSEGVWYSET